MIRYVNDRFIDVELVVSEKPVLKFRIRQLQKTVLYGSKRVFLHREAIPLFPDL